MENEIESWVWSRTRNQGQKARIVLNLLVVASFHLRLT